jgi:hypothetical protein
LKSFLLQTKGRSQLLTRLFFASFAFAIMLLVSGTKTQAQIQTSDTFQIQHAVIVPGGYATSTSFGLNSVLSQVAEGTSSSATLFKVNSGFLYFPFVTTPAISATAGVAQVALSWTSASAGLGWNVGNYSIGQSTVSGGPYTFTSIGTGTNTTRTGLTGGTTYYFVVRVEDGLGNPIATSTQVSATPTAAAAGGGGGGGGGGGPVVSVGGTVNLSGRAYPLSTVTILRDGQIAVTTIAGPDASFSTSLTGLSTGTYSIVVYGSDSAHNRSNPFTFSVFVTEGTVTNINGIFLAPTISVDKNQVKKGDTVIIFGESAANATVSITVNSANEFFAQAKSDAHGAYLYNFDSSVLEFGSHSTKSKSILGTEISPYSAAAAFTVGDKTVLTPAAKCPGRGDVNGDCKVNLADFSIAAFWYKRTLSAAFSAIEKSKLSGDNKVDLKDFSILAYYWTG